MSRNYKKKNQNTGSSTAPDRKEKEMYSKREDKPSKSTTDNANGNKEYDKGESAEPSKETPANKGGIARATNDPEWYSRDNQLVIDAASIPFSQPLGDPNTLADANSNLYVWGTNNVFKSGTGKGEAFSGIMTARTKASFGESENIRSPLNVAANMLYTHVRYMNSGRKNYDPADLMMYVGSMADVYSYIVWMQRVYAKAFVYSQRNKYVGNALLSSEGINAEDVKMNLANLRYWINTYINKVSSYAIPADIYYFNRRAWIYSAIYLENPDGNIKDQLYQFAPDGFFRFELDSNNAGMLKYYKLSEIATPGTNGYTAAQLMSIGEFLLANVTGDEDFGLMAGDIIKAFDGNIIGLPSLPEEVEMIPVYSEYVLEQFHNSTVMNTLRGASTTDSVGDVTQDPSKGIIISHEAIASDEGGTYSAGNEERSITLNMYKILTLNTPQPNPVDVMECSRLMLAKCADYTPNTTKYYTIYCGADYITELFLTYVDVAGDVQTVRCMSRNAIDLDADTLQNHINRARRNLFKFAPLGYIFTRYGTAGTSGGYITNFVLDGNINNYTIVHRETIGKMHEVALLSMLSVPGVAKIINI